MKILSAAQIREADQVTIQNEPISSSDLMERAAGVCFDWICRFVKEIDQAAPKFFIIAGIGNNGGDGLVLARLLHEAAYDVTTGVIGDWQEGSPDFKLNYERLQAIGIEPNSLSLEEVPDFSDYHFIVDAIFGTGLSRPLDESYNGLFDAVAAASAKVIAIDMPSGLMADQPTDDGAIVMAADVVLTFQNPKLSLFLAEHAAYIGDIQILNIGLDAAFIAAVPSPYHLFRKNEARYVRKGRSRFSHKGSFGHVLVAGGSQGMWGAPSLAAKACLRAGAGLVSVYTGAEGVSAIHNLVPEAMVIADSEPDHVSTLPDLRKYSTVALGPGLGQSKAAEQFVKAMIQTAEFPLVIDADALNILAENPTWLSFLPKGSVLTPHPGEFARLVGKKPSHYEAIQLQAEWSRKHGVYIVLKGAFTTVSLTDGTIYFNSSGNPGMASAGMGDTLTGIIAALISCGYSSAEAAIFGVYLHGHAADVAWHKESYESLVATDVIAHLGMAFQSIGYADE